MLLTGSILLQVCLLLTLKQCSSQSYDYGAEESGDDGSYNEGDQVDYSKYYSVDSSAPLVASSAGASEGGFTSPIEFSGFFGPIEFGASQKQEIAQPTSPFVKQENKVRGFVDTTKDFHQFYSAPDFPKDYFEQAQKLSAESTQQGDAAPQNYKLIPGPNYISHQIPARQQESQNKPVKSKPKKVNFDYDEKVSAKSPEYSYEFDPAATNNKFVDYNSGKSSSTVSQYPQAPGHQGANPASASPYQKYSFQPVTDSEGLKSNKYLESLISTIAPFNPTYGSKVLSTAATPAFEASPSENIPKHLKGKNCRRVKKSIGEANEESDYEGDEGGEHGRSKRDAMDCFVCEDPATSSKYTQCSYASENNPSGHYSEHSERYSIPAKETHSYRYKRYSGDYYDSDPYEYVKKESQKAYEEEPKEETKDYEEFKYVPDYYEESAPEKSYSEAQSEQIQKNPANCRKEQKDGMTCTVCKDPKTGGNYEQCSYTVAPQQQKYAYVTEKKYDSADEPAEESESKSAPKTTKPVEESSSGPSEEADEYKPKKDEETTEDTVKYASKKFIQDEPYDIPDHFAEHTAHKDSKSHLSELRGLDPALYGGADSAEAEESAPGTETPVSPYKDLDEYHYKLFPHYERQESQKTEEVAGNPVETTRKDVEEVLAEFSKKDRSACKKAEKKGMTCYLCVDDKGIQHEECMYVSESKPQASHVAYHEVKQIKAPESAPSQQENQQEEPTAAASNTVESKRKRFFKKVTTPAPFTLETAASEESDTRIKYKKPNNKNRRKGSKKSRDPKTASSNRRSQKSSGDDEDEPTQETPAEFQVGDEEGAFSAETKPVYSKKLGVILPKYMVEKSEFEKEFDDFAGNF